jgi:hypothetical protein
LFHLQARSSKTEAPTGGKTERIDSTQETSTTAKKKTGKAGDKSLKWPVVEKRIENRSENQLES